MTRTYITLLLIITGLSAGAQNNTIFLSQGKIEYEKKVNQHANLNDDGWSDFQRNNTDQFRTTYFDLLFTRSKTLYRPGRAATNKTDMEFIHQPAQDNTVYADLDNSKSIAEKTVFEDIFLVQDSLRKIRWKITDETRKIAGFDCRRANAIIMDSIYVVAFYTDEILTSGGPESFTGLPGMILGVALPHQHITWFATKVEAVNVPESAITPPVKGKKVNNATLQEAIQQGLKDWGGQGQLFRQEIML